jgi:hypothetical protein
VHRTPEIDIMPKSVTGTGSSSEKTGLPIHLVVMHFYKCSLFPEELLCCFYKYEPDVPVAAITYGISDTTN